MIHIKFRNSKSQTSFHIRTKLADGVTHSTRSVSVNPELIDNEPYIRSRWNMIMRVAAEYANETHDEVVHLGGGMQTIQAFKAKRAARPDPIQPCNELMEKFGNLNKFRAFIRVAYKTYGIDRIGVILEEFQTQHNEVVSKRNEIEAKFLVRQAKAVKIIKLMEAEGVALEDITSPRVLSALANEKIVGDKRYQIIHEGQVTNWNGFGCMPEVFRYGIATNMSLEDYRVQ